MRASRLFIAGLLLAQINSPNAVVISPWPNVVSVPSSASSVGSPGIVISGGSASGSIGTIQADVFIALNPNNGAVIGNQPATADIESSIYPSGLTGAPIPNPANTYWNNLFYEASVSTLHSNVQVGATVYPPSTPSLCLFYDGTVGTSTHNATSISLNMPYTTDGSFGTAAGFIYSSLPSTGATSVEYDLVTIGLESGNSAYLTLQTGGNTHEYALHCENKNAAVSPNVDISPNTLYWVCINADWNNNAVTANIYETVGWTMVGTTTRDLGGTATSTFGFFRLGNQEGHTAAASGGIYEQNWVINYSNENAFPMGP